MGALGTTEGPWTVGFRAYDVTAADGRMKICDIRGWGYLTGRGLGALGLSHEAGFAIQAANAAQIAAAPNMYDALVKARDQFLFYEQSHLAKYDARDLDLVRKGIVDVPMGRDAYEKAQVNAEMAAMCAAALALASPNPRDDGEK